MWRFGMDFCVIVMSFLDWLWVFGVVVYVILCFVGFWGICILRFFLGLGGFWRVYLWRKFDVWIFVCSVCVGNFFYFIDGLFGVYICESNGNVCVSGGFDVYYYFWFLGFMFCVRGLFYGYVVFGGLEEGLLLLELLFDVEVICD